jgi:hypothetical protein
MNLNDFQTQASAQASDFAKVFTGHATKIAAAQQQWLQAQTDALKAQFEQAVASKDVAASAQSFQNNLQPAAQGLVKHAQELYALTLAAQKDLSAKTQDGYKAFADQANTAVESGIKQLPNQGEPFVSMAKNASNALNGALEQVAEQLKTTQAAYETQVAKLFESAATGFVAPVAAKTAAKK